MHVKRRREIKLRIYGGKSGGPVHFTYSNMQRISWWRQELPSKRATDLKKR